MSGRSSLRADCEKKGLRYVEMLLERNITPDQLLKSAEILSISQYSDVVEERNIEKLCGYPLCNATVDAFSKQQKYHISVAQKKIFDLTERKKFCSDKCFKCSQYFSAQLSPLPLWLRTTSIQTKFKLLTSEESQIDDGSLPPSHPQAAKSLAEPHHPPLFSQLPKLQHDIKEKVVALHTVTPTEDSISTTPTGDSISTTPTGDSISTTPTEGLFTKDFTSTEDSTSFTSTKGLNTPTQLSTPLAIPKADDSTSLAAPKAGDSTSPKADFISLAAPTEGPISLATPTEGPISLATPKADFNHESELLDEDVTRLKTPKVSQVSKILQAISTWVSMPPLPPEVSHDQTVKSHDNKDEDKESHPEEGVFLPPVDSVNISQIQRGLFAKQLQHHLATVCSALDLSFHTVLPLVIDTTSKFRLDRHCITFRVPEWRVIAVLLIVISGVVTVDMLSYGLVQTWLAAIKASPRDFKLMLASFGPSPQEQRATACV